MQVSPFTESGVLIIWGHIGLYGPIHKHDPICQYRIPGKEHWLGLENLLQLTQQSDDVLLRVRLTDVDGNVGEDYYTGFTLRNEVRLWKFACQHAVNRTDILKAGENYMLYLGSYYHMTSSSYPR